MTIIGSDAITMSTVREEIARAKRDARAQAKSCGCREVTFGEPTLTPMPYGVQLAVPFTFDGVAQRFTIAL